MSITTMNLSTLVLCSTALIHCIYGLPIEYLLSRQFKIQSLKRSASTDDLPICRPEVDSCKFSVYDAVNGEIIRNLQSWCRCADDQNCVKESSTKRQITYNHVCRQKENEQTLISSKPNTLHLVSTSFRNQPNTIKSVSTFVSKKQNDWAIVDLIEKTSIGNNGKRINLNNNIILLLMLILFLVLLSTSFI